MFESGSCILDGSVASNLKHLQQAYRHIYCTRGTGKVMGVIGLALIAAEIGDSWASNSGAQSLRQGMGLTSAQACPSCQLRATMVLKALPYNMRLVSTVNYNNASIQACRLLTSTSRHFQLSWSQDGIRTIPLEFELPRWAGLYVHLVGHLNSWRSWLHPKSHAALDGKVSLDAWICQWCVILIKYL